MAVSESSARRYALDPDVRLMLQVRDGSATAFEELVLRYQSRLVRVLEHLVGGRHLAEDLAQEVFLRVFRARKQYVVGAKFATWLFTIASHVASNAVRDRTRRREVALAVGESGPVGVPLDGLVQASTGSMPARQLDKAEVRQVVRLALESLSARQRLAVLLNKFEGMSYADIAATLDLSPPAVKSLLSRARENLRQTLEPYFEYGTPPPGGGAAQPPVAPGHPLMDASSKKGREEGEHGHHA